MQETLGEVLMI